MLNQCDLNQLPAYLETQNEDNLPFYARHGFEITGEVDLPAAGPHMLPMWRLPAR